MVFEQELRHPDLIDRHCAWLLPVVHDVLGAVAEAAEREEANLRVERKLLQVHRTVCPDRQALK